MMKTGGLTITTPTDREILMTRGFDAPRRQMFDAFTRAELLRRRLLGPPGWTLPVCEVDLQVGGRYRYVWRSEKDGRTTLTRTRLYESKAARDMVLMSGMESGVAASYDRLAGLLAAPDERGAAR